MWNKYKWYIIAGLGVLVGGYFLWYRPMETEKATKEAPVDESVDNIKKLTAQSGNVTGYASLRRIG